MERNLLVPVWLILLCLLLCALFTVAFGWSIKSTLRGSDRSGWFGKAAVEIAEVPTLTKDVLQELFEYVSGDYADRHNRVQRSKTVDYSGFQAIPTEKRYRMPGLKFRADLDKVSKGWRILGGAFQINDNFEHAILLISPNLKIKRIWLLNEIPVGNLTPNSKHRKFVHGIDIHPNGSVIFAFDGGKSLQKFSSCGKRNWIIAGDFNHAVTLDDSAKTVWTFSDHETVARVAVKDGAILQKFSMDDIIGKNPMIDILAIRKIHASDLILNSRSTTGKWMTDPHHLNDVDPLPAAIADKFERFAPGDLLISARSLNLVFVLDPKTLKVKWWRAGAVQRQHDADWLANGEISIFNNRMSRTFSQVVAINPSTYDKTVLYDGRKHDFYSRVRGKQQMLADGTLVVTSPQQGRAFEVNSDGDIVLELINMKPGEDGVNYVVSELKWLPLDYFHKEAWQCKSVN